MNTQSEEVINAIKNGEAKMRSRRYFIVKAILIIVGAILLFFFILLLGTFILFALHENGGIFATNFGTAGWDAFLVSLPWSLLLLSIALILILWILLRRYAVIYRQPFLYILLILIVVLSLASFFLSTNAIPDDMFLYASRNRIPVVSGVYQLETTPISGAYRGEVIMLATSSFILGNDSGQTSTVFMISAASSELTGITPGDYVIIFGHRVSTATVEAYGLERIVKYQ